MKHISWWKNYNFFFQNKATIRNIISKFNVDKNYVEILGKKLSKALGIKYVAFTTGTTKLLNNFQGGFCATSDEKIYNRILHSRNHGVYDYYADKRKMPGYNLKPTNLQCFIGINELKGFKKLKVGIEEFNYVDKNKKHSIL